MAGEKILVVDDEKIVGTAFKRELERENYEVDSALDGEKAREMAKLKKYDLIFVDLIMPGMDGVQTCKILKDISPDSTIIFMTGRIDKDTIFKEIEFCKAGGKVYYLYKPFGEGEILSVTRKALAEKGKTI
jgi:DNA-binding response OmpR family regulator